jgi:hypothetical protein
MLKFKFSIIKGEMEVMEDLTWWDVIKAVGPVFLASLGFYVFNYWGLPDIQKALFTRTEKIKYFLSQLLFGSFVVYILFILYMVISGDEFSFGELIMWACVTVLVTLLGLVLYWTNVKRKREGECYYYLLGAETDNNRQRKFIKGRFSDELVILSDSPLHNTGDYLQAITILHDKQIEKILMKDLHL